MGIGAVTVGLAVIAVLAFLAWLLNSSREKRRKPEPVPANLAPPPTDDEMESRRLDKVLLWAVVASAILAVVVPLYYVSEVDRQADAAENQLELDVEEGEHWFAEVFQCADCHGAEGVGGGVSFIEARSGLEITWAAPSLNDVFYRYDEDEVRYWITFGRANTPMPAAGLEGGGSMTSQEMDQVIAYLRSIQIPQQEAFAQTETRVTQALDRIEGGAENVGEALSDQRDVVDLIAAAPAVYELVETVPDEFEAILDGDGTCTDESAALVERPCNSPGEDTDRDGLSDAAEAAISALLSATGAETADYLVSNGFTRDSLSIDLDPATGFTTSDPSGEPIPDLDVVAAAQSTLNTLMINLEVTATRNDSFLENAQESLSFLEESVAQELWSIDYAAVADKAFNGNVDTARRAAGLYNAYCARCHTGGYSAGVAFEQGVGVGGFGPALTNGRSVVQFPDIEDQIEFITVGSQNARPYGVNGTGRGWMPGFGFVLSAEDIRLIVEFERALE